MSYALAALAGVLSFLAYPFWIVDPPSGPTEWLSLPALIFVAGAPFWLVVLREPSRGRRFRLGWLTGFIHLVGMQNWISGTLVSMSHFPGWGAFLGMLAYAAFAGLPWAFLGLMARPARELIGPGMFVALPTAAALLEHYAPVLFPFHTSNAFFEHPFMIQTADLIGIAGVSALIHAVNLLLAETWAARSERRPIPRRPLIAIGALWTLALGYGALRERGLADVAEARSIEVLLVQPNMTVDEKNSDDTKVREVVWARTAQQTWRAVGSQPPDLVVWPEGGFPLTYLPGPNPEKPNRAQRFSERLRHFAGKLGVDFITGGLGSAVDNRASNTAMFFPKGRQGEPERYLKQQLLLFGESVPFADTFPALRDAIPGMSHHVAGTSFATWTVAGLKFAPTICYEAIFSGFARDALAAGDADVLLNVTNDVWFGHSPAPIQHLMVQQPRAIEARRWLVRSTNTGITALIDPTGTIVTRTGLDEATSVRASLSIPVPIATLWMPVGDAPLVILGAACAAWAFWRRRALGRPGPQKPA